MKRILNLFLALLMVVALLAQPVAADTDLNYREVYLNYAKDADNNYDNPLNEYLSGLIMVDLNEDEVPEIIGYSTKVSYFDKDYKQVYPINDGYDNVAYTFYEHDIEKEFAIKDNAVVVEEIRVPTKCLPGEFVGSSQLLCGTYYCNKDGKMYFIVYNGKRFNAITYVGGEEGFTCYSNYLIPENFAEDYSEVDIPMVTTEKFNAAELNKKRYCYEKVEFLLNEYEMKKKGYASKTSDWAANEVKWAIDNELVPVELYGEDLTKTITRAEFAAIAVKLNHAIQNVSGFDIEDLMEAGIADASNHKYEKYIYEAYKLGITKGESGDYPNVNFAPDILISRQDATTMLCRVLVYKPRPGTSKFLYIQDPMDALYVEDVETFADDNEIENYAKKPVYYLSQKGAVKGVDDTHFAPLDNMTREEAIAIAGRICEDYFMEAYHNEVDSTNLQWKTFIDEYSAWADKFVAEYDKYIDNFGKGDDYSQEIMSEFMDMMAQAEEWKEEADIYANWLERDTAAFEQYKNELEQIWTKISLATEQ